MLVRQGTDDVVRAGPALDQRHRDRDDIPEPLWCRMLGVQPSAELKHCGYSGKCDRFDENRYPQAMGPQTSGKAHGTHAAAGTGNVSRL